MWNSIMIRMRLGLSAFTNHVEYEETYYANTYKWHVPFSRRQKGTCTIRSIKLPLLYSGMNVIYKEIDMTLMSSLWNLCSTTAEKATPVNHLRAFGCYLRRKV
jgi:hypothetical protein